MVVVVDVAHLEEVVEGFKKVKKVVGGFGGASKLEGDPIGLRS